MHMARVTETLAECIIELALVRIRTPLWVLRLQIQHYVCNRHHPVITVQWYFTSKLILLYFSSTLKITTAIHETIYA